MLVLIRDWFTLRNVTGQLQYNDKPLLMDNRQVFVCEDVARPDGVKIDKNTAIPAGDYWLTMNYSNRFKQMMPLIYNQWNELENGIVVSGGVKWVGIRQHVGNFDGDTEGCQLIGFTRSEKGVFTSSDCFKLYLPWLENELKNFDSKGMPFKIINRQAKGLAV